MNAAPTGIISKYLQTIQGITDNPLLNESWNAIPASIYRTKHIAPAEGVTDAIFQQETTYTSQTLPSIYVRNCTISDRNSYAETFIEIKSSWTRIRLI